MSWQTARGYCWSRALRMLGERPGTTLVGTIAAAMALAVPSLVFLLFHSIRPILGGSPVAEISAFVAPGTSASDVRALATRLEAIDGVAEVRLLSREQAWNELQRRSKETQALTEFKPNLLPDVLVMEFLARTPPSIVEGAIAQVAKQPRIESVQADLNWYRRLASVLRVGRQFLVPMGGVVAFLTLVILLGVVGTSVTVDPDELRLLDQIGAEPNFIRRPFIYAGALLLGIAAALCLGALAAIGAFATPALAELGRDFGLELSFHWPPWPLVAAFVSGCVLAGAWAAHHFAGRSITHAVARPRQW